MEMTHRTHGPTAVAGWAGIAASCGRIRPATRLLTPGVGLAAALGGLDPRQLRYFMALWYMRYVIPSRGFAVLFGNTLKIARGEILINSSAGRNPLGANFLCYETLITNIYK